MQASTESAAVFLERLTVLGLSQTALLALVAAGYNTMGKLAFAVNHIPGGSDETELHNFVILICGVDPPLPMTMSIFRRAHFEAYTLVAGDLRQRLEAPTDSQPRKLPVAERSFRYREQVARLSGLALTGEMECGDALVDLFCQIFDENRLRWPEWSLYIKRDQEVEGQKKDQRFHTDASGNLRVASHDPVVLADLSSDLLIFFRSNAGVWPWNKLTFSPMNCINRGWRSSRTIDSSKHHRDIRM